MQEIKFLVKVFGIFECLLTQHPSNQDSQLSWFFVLVNQKTGGSWKLFLLENDFKTCSTKLLMPFIVL